MTATLGFVMTFTGNRLMSFGTAEISVAIRSEIQQILDLLSEKAIDRALTEIGKISDDLGESPIPLYLAGLASMRLGEPGKAIEALNAAHAMAPDLREPVEALSILHANLGRLVDSLYFAKLAIAATSNIGGEGIMPGWLGKFNDAFFNIRESPLLRDAKKLFDSGNFAEAVKAYKKEIEVDPQSTLGWHGLAVSLLLSNRPYDGLVAARALQSLLPESPSELTLYGQLLAANGNYAAALAVHQRVLNLAPEDSRLAFAGIRSLACWPNPDPAGLIAAASEWGRKFGDGLGLSRPDPAPLAELARRRLRLGVVSTQWRAGFGLDLLVPVLEQLDRRRVELFCYVDGEIQQPLARRLRGRSDSWQVMADLDDETASFLIRNDGLDILVDLDGPTRCERPDLFAARPAPLLLTTYAWPEAALPLGFDAVLGDVQAYPGGDSPVVVSVEGGLATLPYEVVRSQRGKTPIDPAETLTFGTLARRDQITPAAVALWVDLILALPDAVLVLHQNSLGGEAEIREVMALFAGRVPEGAVLATGADADLDAFLDFVDILLDPPHNPHSDQIVGAIGQSIPVITLNSPVPRSALLRSWLHRIGFAELIAANPADYVGIAQRLAAPKARAAVLKRLDAALETELARGAQQQAAALLDALSRAVQARA